MQPSEAGHAQLAGNTPFELDVVRLLQALLWSCGQRARVFRARADQSVSSPVRAARYQPRWRMPADLVDAAVTGSDVLAAECVALFCRWFGSFAGDLAITFRAVRCVWRAD